MTSAQTNTSPPLFPVHDGSRTIYLSLRDITYLQAEHVYVRIHLRRSSPILLRTSLEKMLGDLPPQQFIRIHRSFVVNANYITSISRQFIRIIDQDLPVSRHRRKAVREQLLR